MAKLFGKMIRALRHGFRLSPLQAGCGEARVLVRLSFDDRGIRADVCPLEHFPRKVESVAEHICWWEDSLVLDESAPLREAILEARPYMVELLLDDDGEVIK